MHCPQGSGVTESASTQRRKAAHIHLPRTTLCVTQQCCCLRGLHSVLQLPCMYEGTTGYEGSDTRKRASWMMLGPCAVTHVMWHSTSFWHSSNQALVELLAVQVLSTILVLHSSTATLACHKARLSVFFKPKGVAQEEGKLLLRCPGTVMPWPS